MKAALALALVLTLLAADNVSAQTPFDGFNLGLKVGWDDLRVDLEGKTQAGEDLDESQRDAGLSMALLLGGGRAVKGILYLGGEFDVARHEAYSEYGSGSRFGLDWSLGGKFRAGLVIARRVLAYGLLGARVAVFEYEQHHEYDHGAYSKHPLSFGAGYGGGLELALGEHLALRAEMSRTGYLPVVNAYHSYFEDLGNETFRPQVLDAGLGLIWYF